VHYIKNLNKISEETQMEISGIDSYGASRTIARNGRCSSKLSSWGCRRTFYL